jgi:hypothetical protein
LARIMSRQKWDLSMPADLERMVSICCRRRMML